MGFAMRMNFVDVVASDSLKNYYVDNKKWDTSLISASAITEVIFSL